MRVLGIDYGERRVGIAVSDPSGTIALPLTMLDRHTCGDLTEAVVGQVTATGAVAIVVGLPLNMNGTHGPMAEAAQAFADGLRCRLGIPVLTYDERLSSCEVERVLLAADMSRKRRRDVRDKLAAQVILQAYLDREVSGHAADAKGEGMTPCDATD